MIGAAGTLRAWAGVHATRPALVLFAVTAALCLLCARAMIDSVGFLLFETPVSLLLLLPVIAGIATGIGSHNTARVPLPEPGRLTPARIAWLLALTGLACLSVSIGQMAGPDLPWQPAVRNVLLHTALAITAARVLGPTLAWLPPVALTLICMLFGYPPSEPGYYWWAMIMEEAVTPNQWAITAAFFLAACVLYTAAPKLTGHIGRFSRQAIPTGVTPTQQKSPLP
ncbi:hypothetical protein ACFP51_35455 [Streptomyces pratens]|uniref:Uncharacterized protein n=1 Tax=Streptomyces pratens TaxID=887456 RepID=A0ABW1MBL1_9ACTN